MPPSRQAANFDASPPQWGRFNTVSTKTGCRTLSVAANSGTWQVLGGHTNQFKIRP